MKDVKRVLICPLDWGIGHATRCVPIIKQLLHSGAEVIVAADQKPYHFLKNEFPNLEFVRFSGTNISYSKSGSQIRKMLFSSFKILYGVFKEHSKLKKIIKDHKIDLVISDNRFGVWNSKVHSVFITHQLNIQVPENLKFLKYFVDKTNLYFINKYNKVWIPDLPSEENLSGQLSNSEKVKIPIKRIGILSRFSADSNIERKPIECLAILSGPEPQRTIFEEKLKQEILKTGLKAIIIQGKPDVIESVKKDNILYISHLDSEVLKKYIQSAKVLICRPGYSSLMDLAVLGVKAIVVPTPGQTEQEYLAEHLHEKAIHLMQTQENIDLELALENIVLFKGLHLQANDNLLTDEINEVLHLV